MFITKVRHHELSKIRVIGLYCISLPKQLSNQNQKGIRVYIYTSNICVFVVDYRTFAYSNIPAHSKYFKDLITRSHLNVYYLFF